MTNSADVLNHILGHPPAAAHSIAYNFLVPNLKGLHNFLNARKGMHSPPADSKAPPTPPPSPRPQHSQPAPSTDNGSQETHLSPQFSTEVSVFAAATEAFSKANINCTIAESMERFKPIIDAAKAHNVRVRGYVSVALGCPYEGVNVPPSKVAEVTATLLEMGVDEVSVADTTGMGTGPRTQELLKALHVAGISNHDIALHFHDTYGQALVNTVVGLEHGIRTFDSSVGGLGGCPYSKGATGNVATEDLVYCLHSLGVQTGVDITKMAEIGSWISKELGRENGSRAGKALLARLS
jgi:hydroxymethylglutaryl-CoA lyase